MGIAAPSRGRYEHKSMLVPWIGRGIAIRGGWSKPACHPREIAPKHRRPWQTSIATIVARGILSLVGGLMLLYAIAPRAALTQSSDPARADWREEYAYTLGMQAYIYAYPLIYMDKLRYDWVTNPDADFYAALNHLHHKGVLSNA